MARLGYIVFHPLLVPLEATCFYFLITPKYLPKEVILGVLISITIIGIVVPIILFYMLKRMELASSEILPLVKERRIPMLVYLSLIFLIWYRIIPRSYSVELGYFFLGFIAAIAVENLLTLFNFKASVQLMGLASLLFFIIGMSIHYETNLVWAISLLVFFLGLATTLRLKLGTARLSEMVIGGFIGSLTQLAALYYWL